MRIDIVGGLRGVQMDRMHKTNRRHVVGFGLVDITKAVSSFINTCSSPTSNVGLAFRLVVPNLHTTCFYFRSSHFSQQPSEPKTRKLNTRRFGFDVLGWYLLLDKARKLNIGIGLCSDKPSREI